MNYKELNPANQQQIMKAHLAQHEADHFQASLNLQKAQAAGDEAGIEEWQGRLTRAASDVEVMQGLLKADAAKK